MTAFKNHSQLEDLKKTPQELDRQRLHTSTLDFYNCPPPIGHVYSVMMETIGVPESLEEFIGKLGEWRKKDMTISQPAPNSPYTPFNPGSMQAFSHYLFERDIREGETYDHLMREAIGYECEWLSEDFKGCSKRFFRERM